MGLSVCLVVALSVFGGLCAALIYVDDKRHRLDCSLSTLRARLINRGLGRYEINNEGEIEFILNDAKVSE